MFLITALVLREDPPTVPCNFPTFSYKAFIEKFFQQKFSIKELEKISIITENSFGATFSPQIAKIALVKNTFHPIPTSPQECSRQRLSYDYSPLFFKSSGSEKSKHGLRRKNWKNDNGPPLENF